MKRSFLLCVAILLAGLLGCARVTSTPESSDTLARWQEARNYQAQGRYELAKQYYQIALAGARTPASQLTLKREIEAVNRMLDTLR